MFEKHWILLVLCGIALCTIRIVLCFGQGLPTTAPSDDSHFDFSRSTQGWVADVREESSNQGVRAVRPGIRDGKPCLELDVDLDAAVDKRRAGEAMTLLHGNISLLRLEIFVPDLAYDREAPPGCQIFVRDDSEEKRSAYSPWLNMGRGKIQCYPLRAGEWNTIKFQPQKGGAKDSPDKRITAGFDPTRAMIVGVKIALSDKCDPKAKLKDTFAIRNVVVLKRQIERPRGRYVDFAAQEKELRGWRPPKSVSRDGGGAKKADGDTPKPQRGPLGQNRPYFFTDPDWKSDAWSDKDISIVSRKGRKCLAIKANFQAKPAGSDADNLQKGYAAMMFEPNLNLDLQALDDNRIAMDVWCEPDPKAKEKRHPGPFDLAAKLCIFSRSSGLKDEKAWQSSNLTHVGGVGRTRLELIPRIGYTQLEKQAKEGSNPPVKRGNKKGSKLPVKKGNLKYGPWTTRADQAVLYVGLSVYANAPWKGTLYVDNVRIGGKTKRILSKVSGFVRATPEGFFVGDHHPFIVRGANVSFLPQKSPYVMERTLAETARMGMTVVRAWGFGDGLGENGYGNEGYTLQPKSGTYDEPSFRQLDYFLALAEKHGLRVVLPLVNYWSDNQEKGRFKNNYGGIGMYMRWAGIKPEYDKKGRLANRHLFFTDKECRKLFKSYLRYITGRVNLYTGRRYGDAPGIFAWELINEPRNTPPLPDQEANGQAKKRSLELARRRADEFHGWATEMSGFIKNECKVKQMVAIGDEGYLFQQDAADRFHDGTYGIDWQKNLKIKWVDFGVCHMYPEHWGWNTKQCERWIREHAQEARNLEKPVLFEEWGLADFSPRPWETKEEKERRQIEAYEALKGYRKGHGGAKVQADKDFAKFYPTFKVLAEETPAKRGGKAAAGKPAKPGQATEINAKRRGEMYVKWVKVIEAEGLGWLMWQVVGPENDDRPVKPPKGCDWMSLGLGYPQHEVALRKFADSYRELHGQGRDGDKRRGVRP